MIDIFILVCRLTLHYKVPRYQWVYEKLDNKGVFSKEPPELGVICVFQAGILYLTNQVCHASLVCLIFFCCYVDRNICLIWQQFSLMLWLM